MQTGPQSADGNQRSLEGDVLDLDDYPRPGWEVRGAVLTIAPDQAGNHVAERLDCPECGPQLMWTPFGDDEQTPGQGTAT